MKENTIYYYGHGINYRIYFKDNVCFLNEDFSTLLEEELTNTQKTFGLGWIEFWFSDDIEYAADPSHVALSHFPKYFIKFYSHKCITYEDKEYKIVYFDD